VRKRFLALMISLSLLLVGCGERSADIGQRIGERYNGLESAQMTAQVGFTYHGQLRSYTLHCSAAGEESYTVEVLAPEHLAGIRAQFAGEDQTIIFEDLCLDAGTVSREKISPAAVLPMLVEALGSGYIFETWEESRADTDCLCAALDTTGEQGKIVYTVWLEKEELAPLYAEIAVENEIFFTVEFTEFEFDAILN